MVTIAVYIMIREPVVVSSSTCSLVGSHGVLYMALYLCVALVPAIGVSVSRSAEGRFGAPGARITDPTNCADQEPRCEHRTLIGGQQGKPLDDTLGIATGRSLLKAGWPHRPARLDVRTAFLH